MMDLVCQESLDDWKSCLISLKSVGGSKGEFKTIHKSGEIRWSGVDSVKLSKTGFCVYQRYNGNKTRQRLPSTFERITDAFGTDKTFTYMNKSGNSYCDLSK
jgi:hypothetical protein